ncbi:MAG TPA: ABC-2 family transporter protein [Sandaracinaceae bacterium LLY-WYZ-13_1]|nr:ABC-2 family transporter protein [Sandaracinaceae bacterium LLY-WYZ-13_1]
MRALRALPTLLRIGVSSAVAYRAEMLVWVLTTTMPLIMLPLWHAVAEEAPIRGFGQARFTAYFLAAFVVRQVVGAWASWTINYEVRTGALNARLLRPIHPVWAYATEAVASIPMRAALALPVGIAAFVITGGSHVADTPWAWAMIPLALAGAWGITFGAHVVVGAMSLWMHQSIKVMDVWSAGFFVFSGYLVPVALFPEWLRWLPAWMPFVYQLGFPVDLMTGALSFEEAARQLALQWAWVAVITLLASVLWKRGLRRYGAFGG